MIMRYLYGDLSDFPRQDNTLDLLQRFVDMATKVLRTDGEVERLLAGIESDKTFMAETSSHILAFEKLVDASVESASKTQADDNVVGVLAEGLRAQLATWIEEGRKRFVAKVNVGIQANLSLIDKRRQNMRTLLRAFFVDSGIPVTSHRIGFSLDPEAKYYEAWARVEDVVGLKSHYALKPSISDFFSSPRRGLELCGDRLDLPVGTKKAWLKKERVIDTIRLDEALLTAGEDSDQYLDLRFQRRGAQAKEHLLLRIPKEKASALQLWRADEEGQLLPIDPDLIDNMLSGQLRQIGQTIAPHLLQLFQARGNLEHIHLENDEEDVVSSRRTPDLIDRVVRHLAPTIIEIHKRSPAPAELCLKVEHKSGRREEIYLRRSDLLARIKQLPMAQRDLFDPLQLDFVHQAGQTPHRESWDEITGKRKDPEVATQENQDKQDKKITDVTLPDPNRQS